MTLLQSSNYNYFKERVNKYPICIRDKNFIAGKLSLSYDPQIQINRNEITNKYISGLSISTKQINSLSFENKEELLSLIDDLLLNGWGKGHIFYEKMRLSPKSDCHLLGWIKTQNISNDDKYISLLKGK